MRRTLTALLLAVAATLGLGGAAWAGTYTPRDDDEVSLLCPDPGDDPAVSVCVEVDLDGDDTPGGGDDDVVEDLLDDVDDLLG